MFLGKQNELICLAAQTKQELINSGINFTEIIETTAGCTVSSHCGPNTLGILFIKGE